MRYLSGCTGPDVDPFRRHPRFGLLAQPGNYKAPTVSRWPVWAADNGCFALKGKPFDHDGWVRWLDNLPREGCIFATAPDVLDWIGGKCVGNAAGTLERAETYLPLIRELGFPSFLVLQDGMTPGQLPWGEFDGLFIGGSDEFKFGSGTKCMVQKAVRRGIPVHMGRVNSYKRLHASSVFGCSTADGNYIKFGPKINMRKVLRWFNKMNACQCGKCA